MQELTVGQVAFIHLDDRRLWEWYRDGLGLLPAGGTLFAGPPAAKVNGLPNPLFPGRWLLDGQDHFQLEFFRFIRPRSKPRRPDETPADLGYRQVGFHVLDFDATLSRLEQRGSKPLGAIVGERGARRAAVRDPDGNWVELMEDDPLAGTAPAKLHPDVRATLRSVTISVADLELASRSWIDGVGLRPAEAPSLHLPELTVWGGTATESRRVVLDGGGVLVELVEYSSPKGRPLPEGHRLCDQGIMNLAIVVRSREVFDRTFKRWVDYGLRPTQPTPLEAGIFRVMYFDLPSGENVELLYPRPWAFKLTGFVPSGVHIVEDALFDATPEVVFAALADHDRLGEWSPFNVKRLEAGPGDPNGRGALRRLMLGPLPFYERVVSSDPPHHYAYVVEKGPLVRRHRGDVSVQREGNRTRVRWSIQLGLMLPGAARITGWLLGRTLRETLVRLRDQLPDEGPGRELNSHAGA